MEYDSPPAMQSQMVKFERLEQPRLTFFFQRKDANGDPMEDSPIFACYEQEAATYGKFHRLIGSSDGKTYYSVMKNSGFRVGQMVPRGKATELMQQAFDAELAAAKENKAQGRTAQAHYQHVHVDDSIRRHQNGRDIMRGLGVE